MRTVEMALIGDSRIGAGDRRATFDMFNIVTHLFKQADDALHVGDLVGYVAAMNLDKQAWLALRDGLAHAA